MKEEDKALQLRLIDDDPLWTKVIIDCAILAGVINPIPDRMMIIIKDFLRDEYPKVTYDYFKKAFRAYAANRLEFKKPAFDHFNPKFISDILHSYKKHRSDLYKEEIKEKKKAQPVKPVEEEKPIDIEEEREKSYKFIDRIFKTESKKPIIASYSRAYEYAIENDLLEMSDKDEEEVMKRTRLEFRMMAEKNKNQGIPYKHILKQMEDPESNSFDYEYKTQAILLHFIKKYNL